MTKIGRPKLDKQAARGCRLHVVLTEAERLELVERSTAAGFPTVSDFVRAATLRRQLPKPRTTTGAGVFSADDRRALVNIGNNLNQLVRLRHSGRDHVAGDELAEALSALHDVLDRYLPK